MCVPEAEPGVVGALADVGVDEASVAAGSVEAAETVVGEVVVMSLIDVTVVVSGGEDSVTVCCGCVEVVVVVEEDELSPPKPPQPFHDPQEPGKNPMSTLPIERARMDMVG